MSAHMLTDAKTGSGTGGGAWVLIAEDDPTTRTMVEQFFKAAQYRVAVARDGEEALALIDKNPGKFDIFLFDVNMPNIGGLELVKIIRQRDDTSQTPVVMMSSNTELELQYRCIQAGADNFIMKPVRRQCITDLWQTVSRKQRENKVRLVEESVRARVEERAAQINAEQTRIVRESHTRLDRVVTALSQCLRDDHGSADVKSAVASNLRVLQEGGLMEVPLVDMVEQSDTLEDAKRWLINMLRPTPVVDQQSREDEFRVWHDHADPVAVRTLRDLAEFDVWTYDWNKMLGYAITIFRDLHLMEQFGISEAVLSAFAARVSQHYQDHAFHNVRHAFDVLQMVYWILTAGGGKARLLPLDVLSLTLAALCVDIGHPGTNNAFQVAARTDLAILYNDLSPLENHSAQLCFQLLTHPDCNILANLSPADFLYVRKAVVDIILATDLERHTDVLARFALKTTHYDRAVRSDRVLLAQVILKCADVSHALRPFPLAKYWADMTLEEGFRQAMEEEKKHMPISPGMNQQFVNQCSMAIAFIDYIAKPLFKLGSEMLPPLETVCLDMLRQNRYEWQEMMDHARTRLSS